MASTLPPAGPGVALLALNITVLALCWLTVLLRLAARRAIHALGLDDWLMFGGLLLWTITAVAIIGVSYHGAGRTLDQIPMKTIAIGAKWYFTAQVTYAACTIPIRCSICCTLLRIGDTKSVYRYVLYGIMVLSGIAGVATIIAIMLTCRPLPAFWGEVQGQCNFNTTMYFGYLLSAVCITADWALAILPAAILWNIQIKRPVKLYVIIILALGGLASCATIVRLRYLTKYGEPLKFLYNAAHIGSWTVVEVGIGICAGSVAQLRPVLRFIPFIKDPSYSRSTSPATDILAPVCRPPGTDGFSAAMHMHKRSHQGSQDMHRIHGKGELDLHTDRGSQDGERPNMSSSFDDHDVESGPSSSSPYNNSTTDSIHACTPAEDLGVIHKEIEVDVHPWEPTDDTGSVEEELDENESLRQPDLALRRSSYKSKVWYRDSWRG